MSCFPAIAYGPFEDLAQVGKAVDTWVHWYNHVRAHKGHVNRGLPPAVLYELWKRTEGGTIAKLVKLGILKVDEEWAMRMMGQPGDAEYAQGAKGIDPDDFLDEHGIPYAFILQKNSEGDRKLKIADSLQYLPGRAPHEFVNPQTGEISAPPNQRVTFTK